MSKHAHLVKVMVQTVWVVINDETGTATEMADPGVVVPAAEWPTFYERHAADFASIQEAVATEEAPPFVAVPNRAARRAKPKPSG